MEKQLRFLILEDLDTDAELMIDELNRAEFNFVHRRVENEKDFVKELKNFKPDLVLSDYSLPTFTGMEGLKIVRKDFPYIPVIIVTGSINEETAVACMKAGASDYVLKDHLVHLPSAVNQTLEKIKLEKEKLEALNALQKSEMHFRSVWENSADGMRLTDKDGNVVSVNRAFCKLVEMDESELVNQPFNIIYNQSKENQSGIEKYKQRFKNKSVDKYLERKMTFSSGKTVDLEISSSFIETDDSNPLLFSIFRDVSERKKAEAEIRKLSMVVEQSPISIIITDTDGNIQYVNPEFCSLTGYTKKEVYGKNPNILKSGEHGKSFYKELWDTITAGNIWKGEIHNKKKNGDLFWEDAIISPLFNEENQISHFIALKEDITRNKELAEQLHQAQKLEAIGQLAGGVAHDFNNLLTIINGYGSLVLEKMKKDDPLKKDITQIVTAGEKAGSLTQQLLAFSRKQIVRPQIININHIISGIEKMLRRLIGEDIKLNCILNKNIGYTKCDPGQIDQIIMNLAVNARDAMPKGGKLTIETSNVNLDDNYKKLHFDVKPGKYVLITVSDNGIGMDAETQKRIFEPFFTTKEVGKGTGLGLATVYGIIKQNNGYIWVYSELNVGTTFKIYLPVAVDEDAPDTADFESSENLFGTEIILLVEDDANVRELTGEILKNNGYKVIVAGNGSEALQEINDVQEDIDLLITDVIMPGMNGRDLAQRLKRVFPELETIYISGYTDETISRHGILEKGIPFIQKPFKREEFLKLVRKVLDNK